MGSDVDLENHAPHARAKIFALRALGLLWYFDLCLPHPWHGSHWGGANNIAKVGDSNWVMQGMTGSNEPLPGGYAFEEIRYEFAAQLAYALASASGRFEGSVIISPQRIVNDRGENIVNPDPWFPFQVPYGFHDLDSPFSPSTTRRQGESFVCYPETLPQLRRLVCPEFGELHQLELYLGKPRASSQFGFPHEEERWFIDADPPDMATVVQSVCDRMGLELETYTHKGPIEDFDPDLAEDIKARSKRQIDARVDDIERDLRKGN